MNETHLVLGLLAHVDAGKTTLSEALLYQSGARRTLGRVDHADAFLDTHSIERTRGITVFSKQALFSTGELHITLVDTPGHADFSSEAERMLPALDCAVLVISGTDGIQAHTLTLWKLLERYHVPVFLFINKMDLPGLSRQELLAQLQNRLSPGCADLAGLPEAAAMDSDALLEQFLETGCVPDAAIREQVAERKLFPCCFGSALKLDAVDELLGILERYAPRPNYPGEFGAKVCKITRDPQGNRLTWLKITGGSLKVRAPVSYSHKNEALQEKVLQLRLYSGEKFTVSEEVFPGQLCAVTGLSATRAGQGLGITPDALPPAMEPVMTYRIELPAATDPATVLPKLRQLEEEDPQLHILWDEQHRQIHAQIMGNVQLEVLSSLISQRFSLEVSFDSGRIFYKETIAAPVEGVGRFEPLRHYAEVHLLLEPLPRGSGLVFDTACSTDILDLPYQKLILSHLSEKTHLGVLTGSPITDMKITLLIGKAHVKHTEGGDFRQATYRAVRQGLMQAESILLEPWYSFQLTTPSEHIGRAITDIRAMDGDFQPPETEGEFSVLTGRIPAACLGDYPQQLASYTQGRGILQLSLDGYAPCHNQQTVVEQAAYDPEADLENTPDSVFCGHGAGFTVKWHQVKDYMHLDSGLKKEKTPAPAILTRNVQLDDKELEAIMEREFGPIKRPQYQQSTQPATEAVTIRPPRQTALIVDGYNIIHAWDHLAKTAEGDLDAARRQLCDTLSSYAGFRKCYLVVVFDGYKVKGNPGEKTSFHNIQVVYTKENETADTYIEALASQIGRNYAVKVATSDALVQLTSLRAGVLRMSARELLEETERARKEMAQHFKK